VFDKYNKFSVDTAHDYMECSNKGECDRKTGLCNCYDGYDGVSCQRASCPGFPSICSGHGMCKTINQLAQLDNDNVYLLWDKNVTMGCSCDTGFYGPDCSLRSCKFGLDPLYLDDSTTIKYAAFDFAIVATATALSTSGTVMLASGANADFTAWEDNSKPGKFAIRFYDNLGQAWVTAPIPAGSTCSVVTAALYALPNGLIPPSSLKCTQTIGNFAKEISGWNTNTDADPTLTGAHSYLLIYQMAFWEAFSYNDSNSDPNLPLDSSIGLNRPLPDGGADPTPYTLSAFAVSRNGTGSTASTKSLSGSIYRIKFTGNPGVFKEPEIETYLDGNTRPSIKSSGIAITKVWTDGQQGEYNDHHADHCDQVTVTISNSLVGNTYTSVQLKTGYSYLTGLTVVEANLLKACLGDSDGDPTNNVDVYNWDYGSSSYPHFIKLVRSVTTYQDGGYYAALFFDTNPCPTGTSYGGCFRLLNPFMPPDAKSATSTDVYEVYTTAGTLARASASHKAIFDFGGQSIYTMNSTADVGTIIYPNTGDVSCATGVGSPVCVNKGDLITVLSTDEPGYNPPHINLYTANALATNKPVFNINEIYPSTATFLTGTINASALTNVITTDLSLNWGITFDADAAFRVYKFTPSVTSTYAYVAECSNRGICNRATGSCNCFSGYTDEACNQQNSLAL
jgi:hypothetical protein